jgi:hypoxanthine phosphoribosyltransferase
MAELILFITKSSIEKMVAEVAGRISSDYSTDPNCELICIGTLKGSFIFLADLVRHLRIPVKIDFVGVSSYGSGTNSSEKIQLTKPIQIDIRNRHVLLVEDIVDTGLTLAYLLEYMKGLGPKSIRTCVLIDKRERRSAEICIDYVCKRVNEGFLVGYGLDYAEDYRYLPDICHLKI